MKKEGLGGAFVVFSDKGSRRFFGFVIIRILVFLDVFVERV